jgi:hypothetical protein
MQIYPEDNVSLGAPGGGGSDGSDGSSPDNITDPNVNGTEPFSITINGLVPGESGGVEIPATSFTIGVVGGDAIFPTATRTFPAPTGFSATFPSGDGKKYYRVYGKVVMQRSTPNSPLDTIVTASSVIVIEASDTGSFGNNVVWRKDGSNYEFFFAIGVVAAVRLGSRRTAFVNQIQSGNYRWSDGSSGTSDDDENGNDTRDGLRRVIFCINGEPYEGNIEVVGLTAL